MRRRFLALAASIGLAFVACLVLTERMMRPVSGRPSTSTPAAAPVVRPPLASASPAPPPALRAPEGTAAAPQPLAARAATPRRPAPPPAPASGPRVEFSFKLDPRLTSGLHMGTRWVSPRTYTRSGDSKSVTVEARARLVDVRAQRSPPMVTWTASEPDMVEVSPEQGDEVKLTVWRPGESKITARGSGVTGTLTVRAAEAGGALRVEIVR